MGRRCNPVNLKSNTMKNTLQRYVFLLLVQTFSTELCSFLTIIVHYPVDMLLFLDKIGLLSFLPVYVCQIPFLAVAS